MKEQTNTLRIQDCIESPTNPRGSKFEDKEFDELVASIKEKGVLMPVLARPVTEPKGRQNGTVKLTYEIVAGNRRLRAAQKAGLTEIPARVAEMTDIEAREAQIVENLQRADIHPIDEAFAYRDLIESAQPKLDVEGVAAKVGKSVSYVRQRLVLSELDAKVTAKVRAGELPVGHAALIARLDKAEQAKAMKAALDGEYDLKDMRDYVATVVFHAAMKSPPWKDDAQAKAEIAKVTGLKGGEKNLFGEEAAENIENPADYARALAAYLQLKVDEYKNAGKPLTLVSGDYSTTTKGIIGRSSYNTGPGHYKGKCKSFHDALVVEGDGIGKMLRICTDKACSAHNWRAAEETPTAKANAKARRKKEIAAAKTKVEKDTAAMATAVAKMAFPLPEAQLDALIELALGRASHDTERQIVKRRGLQPLKKKQSWGGTSTDYSGAIRTSTETMEAKEKVGLLFELLVDSYSPHYNDRRNKAFKML